MKRRLLHVITPLIVMAFAATLAYAQGGGTTTSLSGVVVDSSGAVIPGVDVSVKNNATGVEARAVTDSAGRFVVPGLIPGTYTLKVSLMGFKTFVSPDVKMLAATPENARIRLEVGAVEETVVVTGATEILQTQSAAVQTTLQVKQIQQLPLSTHTALDYIISLPGLNTSGSNNTRGSTINNLPQRAMNVTLDGINVQDNRSNGEGFFMYIRPMMDSVEEITVSTSTEGAESTGAGAAQIRMTTRAGSNRFSGAAYNSWRNQAGTTSADTLTRTKHPGWLWGLNTPYWFNKRDIPKTAAGDYFVSDIRLQTPGFRVGGPALKDKLFYFFNWEWFIWPNSAQRTRYLMKERAAAGNFTYKDNSGNIQTVNLLAIAAANGQTSTPDPTLAKLYADMRTAVKTQGGIDDTYDLNEDKYSYSPTGSQSRNFPTLRLDSNITPAHRFTFTGRWNHFGGKPDVLNGNEPPFPGFPNQGGQGSERYSGTFALRSTLGKRLVNELQGGFTDATGMGTYFSVGVTADQFDCTGLGCQSLAGTGWAFNINPTGSAPGPSQLTNPYVSTSPSADVAATKNVEDTVTWLRGAHTISFGANFTRVTWRAWSNTVVKGGTVGFGTSSLDTVAFNMLGNVTGAANYPGGIDATQAGYARNLYALVTGRVTSITGNYVADKSGKYSFNGEGGGGVIQQTVGTFVSDSWRIKPNLTLTGGLRYEVQLPIRDNWGYATPQTWQMVYGITGAGAGKYGEGNMFKPGVMTGTTPVFVKYDNSKPAYKIDWNNLGPSVGAAWRPTVKGSALKAILGEDPVFRGGYSLSFTRWATPLFTTPYSNNPGQTRTGTRTTSAGTPLIGFDGFPVLLRDTARLTPGTLSSTSLTYPFSPSTSENVRAMFPDQTMPMTHQYSFGIQRRLGKDMVIEARYVGNTNVGEIQAMSINASSNWSMLAGENGFYDEFRKAQKNLLANLQAGLTGANTTFAYTGQPGTVPLPIFMAYLQGIPLADARNQNPANYTSANFRSSSWYTQLAMYSPNLTGIAGTGTSGLQNGSFEANAAAAGLPLNFFMANPAVKNSTAALYTQFGNRRFNAIQLELRRRMSHGLLVGASYQRQFAVKGNLWRTLRESWSYVDSTSAPVHAIKGNWVFELPFGRGRRFGSGASSLVNRLISGWEFDGVLRTQSGDRFNYGAYRLVGVSESELQKMFGFHKYTDANGATRIYMWPKEFVEQSIIAIYKTDAATTTGYANNVVPTGKYLAPADGPDCVAYANVVCPGTQVTRILQGPWFFKTDISVVKRIGVLKSVSLEARMDLFNVFNNVNFVATTRNGSTLGSWEVNSAATDLNAAQDAGGRITQFGLRITW